MALPVKAQEVVEAMDTPVDGWMAYISRRTGEIVVKAKEIESSNDVALRSGRDRIRYTVTFELVLIAMLIPAGSAFFDKPAADIGVLGIIL